MSETVHISVGTELYEQLKATAEALGMPIFWATAEAIQEWVTDQQKWEVVKTDDRQTVDQEVKK